MILKLLKPILKGLTLASCSLLLFKSPAISQTNTNNQSTPENSCLVLTGGNLDTLLSSALRTLHSVLSKQGLLNLRRSLLAINNNERDNWINRVGKPSAVIFKCSPDTDENGVEILSVATKAPNAHNRYHIPLVRFTSNYFRQSGYTPQKRCEKIATRFQHFHNCGILDNLLKETAMDARTGKTYPAIFAEVKLASGGQLATQDLCPALKPTNGKLLLLMFEPGIKAGQVEEKLNDLRLGNFPEPLSDF